MWFQDDDEEEGFGGMLKPNPMAAGMPDGGQDDNRMRMAMAMASMASLFNPEGRSPALQTIQMMQQMKQGNQRNAIAQGRLKLQMDEAARQERLRKQAGDEIAAMQQDPQQAPMETASPGFDNMPAREMQSMGAGPAGGTPFNQRQAQFYRRMSLRMAAEGNSEGAKRYSDIANSLAPMAAEEKWEATPRKEIDPVTKQPVLALYSDKGNRKVVQGAQPVANYTSPTASANGMITMDQDTGQTRELGVGVHQPTSSEIQQYRLAQEQGFKGSIFDFKKQVAASGAARHTTTLSPVIRVGNAMGEKVGADVATQAVKDVQGGHAATQALNNVQTVRENLPEAITGPLAGVRTFLTRAANAVGIGDYTQKLQATQRTVQGLARMSLDGAAMMEGQGQITQPERELIDKAASAPQDLSEAEIAATTDLVERVQQYKLTQAKTQGQALLANPQLAPVHPHVRSQLDQMENGRAAPTKPQAPAKPQGGFPRPNSKQIGHLKANPALAAAFDAKFGPGAAARILGSR